VAILLHLAETYGRERGCGPTAARRAPGAVLVGVGAPSSTPYMMQYLNHGLDSPVSYKPDQRSQATADYNHGQFRRLLDALDARLEGREHLLGQFSLADIPAAGVLMTGTALGVSLEGRANVEAWLARCRARPALARST
jgi:GST-like protein